MPLESFPASSYQPELPLVGNPGPPPKTIIHRPGELFSGTAVRSTWSDQSLESDTTPDGLSTEPTATIDTISQDVARSADPTVELSVDEPGVESIDVDETRVIFGGLKKRWHTWQKERQESKLEKYEQMEYWAQIAREGKSYKDARRPKSAKEERIAKKAFYAKDHANISNASMSTRSVGVYKINPATRGSEIRYDDPQLKEVSRATQRSAKREEKLYARDHEEHTHAHHKLHPEGKLADKRQEAQSKLHDHERNLRRIQKSEEVRVSNKSRKQARRSELRELHMAAKNNGLADRASFYEDLADVAQNRADGGTRKPTREARGLAEKRAEMALGRRLKRYQEASDKTRAKRKAQLDALIQEQRQHTPLDRRIGKNTQRQQENNRKARTHRENATQARARARAIVV